MAPPRAPSQPEIGRSFRRMLRYSRPYLLALGVAIACAFLLAGARYGRAYLMKPLLDDVMLPVQAISLPPVAAPPAAGVSGAAPVRGPQAAPLSAAEEEWQRQQIGRSFRWILLVAFVIVVVMPLGIFGRHYLLFYSQGRMRLDIQRQLAAKLLRLPLSYHSQTSRGDTLTRALRDAESSQQSLALFYGELLEAAVMVLLGVSMLVYISWQLSLVSMLLIPILAGVVLLFGRKIHVTSQLRQAQLGEVTQRLMAILSGTKVIKAFRGEEVEQRSFDHEAEKLFRRNMVVAKTGVISHSFVEAFNAAVAVGLVMLGTFLVLRGRWGLTGGDVAAFAAVLGTTYKPIRILSRCGTVLVEYLVSADRFFEILDSPEEPADPPGALRIDGVRESIRFENVCFSHGRLPVLRDVSFEVRPGEVVAIVGRSGEGKTTLVDLLFRFGEPDSGRILIDGVDLRRIARESLLDHVALVTQEPFLFDTTILENIRYGRPGASDDEVRAAAAVAHVDEFVAQLPDGYATAVGEFGARLSGGQRQRITIARALLKDPAILVCDEATSALDAKTERAVQEAIEALRGRRTVFVVAHRLSTIRAANRIAMLENGTVTQTGSHEDLMSRSDLYRELVHLQVDSGAETRGPIVPQ